MVGTVCTFIARKYEIYPLDVGDFVDITNNYLILFNFLQYFLSFLDRFLQVEVGSVSRSKLQLEEV